MCPPLIVVDIQPTYKDNIYFDLEEFSKHLNEYEGDITYFYNGPDIGLDEDYELYEWLMDHGVTEETLATIKFRQKTYGWIREPMDEQLDEDDIVSVLKCMISNDESDSRYLESNLIEELDICADFEEKLIGNRMSMGLPEKLSDFSQTPRAGIIIGGGENECLLETELVLQALGKTYERNDAFVY